MQGHRPRVPYMRKLFKLLFVELDPCLEPRPESEAIIDLAIDPCQPTGKTSSRPVTPATTMARLIPYFFLRFTDSAFHLIRLDQKAFEDHTSAPQYRRLVQDNENRKRTAICH